MYSQTLPMPVLINIIIRTKSFMNLIKSIIEI